VTPIHYGRPGERRADPRVESAAECEIPELGVGKILNISVSGAFVGLADDLDRHPPRIRLRSHLGDGLEIDLAADVVREAVIAPRGRGLGVRFVDPDEPTLQRLHRYVLGRLLNEVAEVMEQRPDALDPASISIIRGQAAVISHLKAVLEGDGILPGVLFQRDVADLLDVNVTTITQQRLTLTLRLPSAQRPRVGEHVHVNLSRGSSNIHLHAQVLDRDGASLSLEVPASLTRFELRRAPRIVPGPGTMFVEIPLPFPPGKRLRREVLDISATGLAFKTPTDESYFLPGTPLRDLVILGVAGSDEGERRAAQVMHVTPARDDQGRALYLKIGVDFGIGDEAFKRGVRPGAAAERRGGGPSLLGRMSALFGQLIPRRAAAAGPARRGLEIELVRYPNARREEIVAILNTTPREEGRRLRAPVIVIPPAHGKRKESTSGLALTLIENFAARRRDLVVLRYDGVRNLGESYKDPECREHGREALKMTLSQGVDDLQATLDYIDHNPIFSATEVILVSFSLQAVIGRRALFLDRGRRIRHWIAVNGAPYARDLICNAAGGVDYIGDYASGRFRGVGSILGVLTSDLFCEDALRSGLAEYADAQRELPAIVAPITWILGRHDAWVDPARTRALMDAPAAGPRATIELDCGHIPLGSEEALGLFSEITRAIWRSLHDEDIEVLFPDWREFSRVRAAEWRRTPRSPLPDKQRYWATYLLGGDDQKINYDVLNACQEYLDFLDRQAELLALKPEHRLADMGCGTGNFLLRLLDRRGARARLPVGRVTLVDLVPAALALTERKLARLHDERGVILPVTETRALSLEMSPLRVFRSFLAGDFYGYDPLKGVMRGLGDYSVEMWKAMDDWRLHELLRGRELDRDDQAFLKGAFPADEQEVILDVNRICRWLLGKAGPADLNRDGRRALEAGRQPRFIDLDLRRLAIKSADAEERLPFPDGGFDRVISSLVLSYVEGPLETLREFHRILAPGGRLVVSSMRPDTDMSRIYQSLLLRLEAGENLPLPPGLTRLEFIADLRRFLSDAAFLLTLAEEGHFVFFTQAELRRLLERAGFRRVESFTALGDPPQAHISVGYR
jgi:ubiquinone/menaquinone biosynthesis C-methylase UbiE